MAYWIVTSNIRKGIFMAAKIKKKPLKFINYKAYLLIIILLVLAVSGLNVMFRISPVFSNTYATTIYPHIAKLAGALMSVFPFSVIEVLCYGAVILFIYSIARLIVTLIRNRAFFGYRLKRFLLNLACIILVCLLIFTLNDFVLYNRLSFADCAYIMVDSHSKDELAALYKILAGDANDYSGKVNRDSNGIFNIDDVDVDKISTESMRNLSKDYPFMPSYYPAAKPVFSSKIMTYTFTEGFFSPITMEANYNKDMPDIDIPHTICHELSHLGGFIHEDEANFIGYLACMKSGDASFCYSGTISVLTYVMNSMYDSYEKEDYYNYIEMLDESVINDISNESAYWRQHETVVADISNAYNDAYIKFNGDEEGEMRYQMVVELLLEYYEKDIEDMLSNVS